MNTTMNLGRVMSVVAVFLFATAAAVAGPPAPDRDPDKTLNGDLTDGVVIDNAWATQSNVGCFPATSFGEFDGK
jgi:hypothetical protein